LAEVEEYIANAVYGEWIGKDSKGREILLVEVVEGAVSLQFDEIVSTCTRLEAVRSGVPQSFKEWWVAYRKHGSESAA
jgi:hypothetical protein